MDYIFEKAKYFGRQIKRHFRSHNAKIKVMGYQYIPELQRFIFTITPSKGTTVKRIFDRARDIQSAIGLHLLYPYKVGSSIHLAVSEYEVKENKLLKILRSPQFTNSNMKIPIALGYEIMGHMHIVDLTELIHLLIVGPSGSGKSVLIRCLLMSIVVRCSANSVKLLLFDIGANSLSIFNKVKHLYHPIIKDVKTGIIVLESLVFEMDRRNTLDESECQQLPFIVCIIDEFDDTVSYIDDKRESNRFTFALNSLIRRGRKARIVLILASHHPSLQNTKINVNGIMSRIAFQCSKHHSSSTALGVAGAERLPSGGALLFKTQKGINYLQGSYITSPEIEKILNNAPDVSENSDKLNIINIEKPIHLEAHNNISIDKVNEELAEIALWALGCNSVSDIQVQKLFRIGNRASEIVEKLFEMGIVGEKFAKQPRKVLIVSFEDLPSEAVDFFKRYGYSQDQIAETLNLKGCNSPDFIGDTII